MMIFSVLLLLASADPAAGTTTTNAAEAKPKEEKKICRRINATESRMASKRICKTAKQWKAEQYDTDEAGIERAKAGLAN